MTAAHKDLSQTDVDPALIQVWTAKQEATHRAYDGRKKWVAEHDRKQRALDAAEAWAAARGRAS